MDTSQIRQRIKKWELLRVPFNLVCMLGSWMSWGIVGVVTVGIDELPAPTLSDPGVIASFIYGFAVLNVAYSLIYAVEFVGRAISDRVARWCAIAAYIVGCVFGMLVAAKGSSGIALSVVTESRITAKRGADRKEMIRRMRAEAEAQKKELIQQPQQQRPCSNLNCPCHPRSTWPCISKESACPPGGGG